MGLTNLEIKIGSLSDNVKQMVGYKDSHTTIKLEICAWEESCKVVERRGNDSNRYMGFSGRRGKRWWNRRKSYPTLPDRI
ncbi:MAG: hypothetical protein P9X24_02285 [Candidatus Hatepunaea meridiana]|nr:hypothetical protein [Candidatus Hatepunaea meridiana]